MNTRVLIFGTLFLIGNISFGATAVVREGLIQNASPAQTRIRKSVKSELEDLLSQKGIESDAASEILSRVLSGDDMAVSIAISNYLDAVPSITYDALLQEVATRALFGKKVDFGSYDTLVSLTQSIEKSALNKMVLQELHEIANINQSLEIA
jgi:hypothetical protein